jgi:hypothetical protein
VWALGMAAAEAPCCWCVCRHSCAPSTTAVSENDETPPGYSDANLYTQTQRALRILPEQLFEVGGPCLIEQTKEQSVKYAQVLNLVCFVRCDRTPLWPLPLTVTGMGATTYRYRYAV